MSVDYEEGRPVSNSAFAETARRARATVDHWKRESPIALRQLSPTHFRELKGPGHV